MPSLTCRTTEFCLHINGLVFFHEGSPEVKMSCSDSVATSWKAVRMFVCSFSSMRSATVVTDGQPRFAVGNHCADGELAPIPVIVSMDSLVTATCAADVTDGGTAEKHGLLHGGVLSPPMQLPMDSFTTVSCARLCTMETLVGVTDETAGCRRGCGRCAPQPPMPMMSTVSWATIFCAKLHADVVSDCGADEHVGIIFDDEACSPVAKLPRTCSMDCWAALVFEKLSAKLLAERATDECSRCRGHGSKPSMICCRDRWASLLFARLHAKVLTDELTEERDG